MHEFRNFDDPQYKKWRYLVYKRDRFTCRLCGKTGDLNAHHIKRWADFPALRFIVSNGITLCKLCHSIVKDRESDYEAQFTALVAQKLSSKPKASRKIDADNLLKVRMALRKNDKDKIQGD